MARKYRTNVREVKAVEYAIEIKDLNEYKDIWLILCNNAREYPKDIYKVSNDSSSTIYVLANPDIDLDLAWISQFGDIVREDIKFAVFVDVDCEYTKSFDEDYIDSEYVLGETY